MVSGQAADSKEFESGYQTAMMTMYIVLDKVLNRIEDSSATLESARREIKFTKEFCLDEFFDEEDEVE